MPYVIQANDQEIDLDLLQQLADVLLAEERDLTRADATHRIRRAGGLLRVADRAEADRICARFTELGLSCFVVDRLLDPPRRQHLNLEKPELDGEVTLAVVVRLHLVSEKIVSTTRTGLSVPWTLAGVPVPVRRTDQKRIEESDTRYSLDLFTSTTHWRAQPGFPQPIRDLLPKVVTPATSLNSGAASLLQGGKDLPQFGRDEDYEHYLTWLYQCKSAGKL